jgi:hypothetical protein
MRAPVTAPATPPPPTVIDIASLVASGLPPWRGLRLYLTSLLAQWLSRDKSRIPDIQIHSLMLKGYGNAMAGLGWRYEKGGGVLRNCDEAWRCYRKAARMGNGWARWRISQPDPSPLPVLPPDGSTCRADPAAFSRPTSEPTAPANS